MYSVNLVDLLPMGRYNLAALTRYVRDMNNEGLLDGLFRDNYSDALSEAKKLSNWSHMVS